MVRGVNAAEVEIRHLQGNGQLVIAKRFAVAKGLSGASATEQAQA
jgi:hypothetical protein